MNLEKQKEIANLLLEHIPALLTSREGLKVACGVFTISNAKDRKTIVKNLKSVVKELAVHPIGSIFLVKVINSYDDTVSCKKYVVNELVTHFEDLF